MKKIIIIALLHTIALHTTPSLETGIEYQKNEQFNAAISCYEEIITDEPYNINASFNLGCCHLAIGQYEKAIAAFNYVISLAPEALPAHYNKAFTYKTWGNMETAINLYKEIIEANPDYEPAQLALGFAYITQGDFEHGWQQHERYLKKSNKNGEALRALLQNNSVPYKKILLNYEGGLGDTIMFIRYAERLKDMGAEIIVRCQKQLIPLLSRCTYIDQLIPEDEARPDHDASASLMSLPAIFNDDENSVPHTVPYLHTDPALIEYWQQQLATDTNFKIGICWQASIHNDVSRLPIARRGCPLHYFSTLNTVNGVSFYSLQKHDGLEELNTLPSDFTLHSFDKLDEKSGPLMDTAALMKNLDLIITVDTAIAHLAGALGCKVWLLHPYATANWTWICHRTDSYWYPHLRIFKQQKPFDWDGVMKGVHQELHKLLTQQ